jgi:spermidine synthase
MSLSSFFGPRLLARYTSKFSGDIRVMQALGYRYVATGILTQSGGVVAEVWQPVLKKLAKKHQSWLILGLATGTVAEMISKKISPTHIVGVEIDPIMLEIGRKFFSLSIIPDLEIVQADALSYIKKMRDHFDVILVDMYLGDKLPEFVYSPKFLHSLKLIGRTVVFNHLFYDEAKKAKAEKFINDLKVIFPTITLQRVLTNVMITCQ